MKNSKVLPLNPIDLKSRPHNHRALAWSSDAELAIAADDSVAIYLPTFPFLDPANPFALDKDVVPDQSAAAQDENGMGILPANLPANDEGDDDLGSDNEDDEEDDDDDDEGEDGGEYDGYGGGHGSVLFGQHRPEQARVQEQRQFADETSRVLWVSYPALHPELNLHVWEAAGKAMPLIRSGPPGAMEGDEGGLFGDGARGVPPVGEVGEPMEGVEQAQQQQQQEQQEQQEQRKEEKMDGPLMQEVHSHPGAGTGVIGGAGSSLNHVVAIEWSPSGLGRNLRPVLAVLTGCGSLSVYGEGGPLPFGSNTKPSRVVGGLGKSVVRDLQSWLALWAVGENFVVPGQEEFGYGEFVKAFAWCEEVSAGRALLSYMNDLREIVILSVGTTFRKTQEGLEEAIWNVQEMARMETGGPHGQVDICNPDYVPSGSSYCIQWSPWAKGKDTWSCLLSYMDRNYVGFKKITINSPTWSPNEGPHIIKETADWDGKCIHLATDAFLEFENTIWNINGNLICRGIIATPLLAEPFEINLSTAFGPKPNHSTSQCNTTLPPQSTNNPITGLVIHPLPLETTAPPLTPLYTAVRLSATATNPHQWVESNHHHPASPPQWLNTIQTLITRHVSIGQAGREGDLTAEAAEEGEDGIVRGPDADDEYNNNGKSAADNDDQDDSEDEQPDPDADFDPWANEGPDVYPHSMRIWGIARSPGGGSTAILATPLLTQRPMRSAWGAHRSRVLFGWRTRVGESEAESVNNKDESSTITTNTNNNHNHNHGSTNNPAPAIRTVNNLTTEARLWEWMYGSAPGIPGLTPPLEPESLETARQQRYTQPQKQHTQDQAAMARRACIRELCHPLAAAQTCGVCGVSGGGGGHSPITQIITSTGEGEGEDEGDKKGGRVLAAKCARGHRFAVCGVTGLAIMTPGISRACGVCQSRVLGWDFLLERKLKPAGVGEEDVAVVKSEMDRDICARCGGKYLD